MVRTLPGRDHGSTGLEMAFLALFKGVRTAFEGQPLGGGSTGLLLVVLLRGLHAIIERFLRERFHATCNPAVLVDAHGQEVNQL